MTYRTSLRSLKVEDAVVAFEPAIYKRKTRLQATLIEFVRSVIGNPDYSFTLTLKPVAGPRRITTKISDAEQAMDWFLHVLNTKCFGHGYRRKSIELGIFATIEGLGIGEQPHLHGVIRLPNALPAEKFLKAFEYSKNRTKRFGYRSHLEPYYEHSWLQYITKAGLQSGSPRFLRQGTP
jgi:hypothetical protein